MSDIRTLENRFLGTVQAMVGVAACSRQFCKALINLPESAEASEAMAEALLAGIPKERLRTIAKACQGDSRRGREMAARLSEWIDAPREVAKALEESLPVEPVAEPAPDTRTAIKALRERLDGEAREIAKAHVNAHTRTIHGRVINVSGYDTAAHKFLDTAEVHHLTADLAAHRGDAVGSNAYRLSAEAAEANASGDKNAAKQAHAKAADAHEFAAKQKRAGAKDSRTGSMDRVEAEDHDDIAKRFHRKHAGFSDTTPPLNHDDNMPAHPKEVIHPKTDMVD